MFCISSDFVRLVCDLNVSAIEWVFIIWNNIGVNLEIVTLLFVGMLICVHGASFGGRMG